MTTSAPPRPAPRGPRAGGWDDPTQPIAVVRHGQHSRAPRTASRPPALVGLLLVVVVVIAAVTGVVGYRTWVSVSPPAPSAAPPAPAPPPRAAPSSSPAVPDRPPERVPRGDRDRDRGGALGTADGAVPDGTTVFDDDIPAVANLDPDLLAALRQAAADAADDRIAFVVNSGWRSPEYQQHLLDEAVSQYGSKKAAARWVATPDTSSHVSGDAIDIGPTAATTWLAKHGAEHGLCQTYRNEPWHYELHPDAADDGCPRMYADPTKDPRMQK